MAGTGLFSQLTQATRRLFRSHEKKYGALRQFIGGVFHQDCTLEEYFDDDDRKLVINAIKYSFENNAHGASGLGDVLEELDNYLDNHKVVTEHDFRMLGFDYIPDDISFRDFLVLMSDAMKSALSEMQPNVSTVGAQP
ncbi:hypothetical protein J2D73_19335 [Acetobacter sacchari]|uniref:CdiI immunity protein domain-containing protein n=1 Tax=Acetobacter sacchari TaxID=2661687 RepID=A0ABS3M1F3_9PROT|nr:hypothetical protein [Acetobacter sacchari]MBO1361940.1 hypothetical protein [Acetobacter sacchari]